MVTVLGLVSLAQRDRGFVVGLKPAKVAAPGFPRCRWSRAERIVKLCGALRRSRGSSINRGARNTSLR